MSNVHSILPTLTVNELFIRDLMSEEAPCFALGYVEVNGDLCGFLAVRPAETIPSSCTANGFSFGHSVLGIDDNPVLHFGFHFYGHNTYHGLVNPGNPIVQSVLTTMTETGQYFFFSINPDQTVTSFGATLEDGDLAGLKTNLERFKQVTCMPAQYEKTVKVFSENPSPPGQMLNWVCRDNKDYLNLNEYPLEMTPKV